ncbi:SDR family NAD(P)-dependent oxidoreductase [Burkholderia gladioli]|nr:SDR family oxidoreductase [Burkholderia sp. ISTR5]POS04317.1 SDR family NAD(P)-dependent oxidoreductase [Burkholderia gladioli]
MACCSGAIARPAWSRCSRPARAAGEGSMPFFTPATNELSPAPACPPRLALITGASGGVGRCCAKALADIGYATIVVGRDPDRLAALVGEIEALPRAMPCIALAADLKDREAIRGLLARIATLGVPEVFISAAGMTSTRTDRFTDAELDEAMALNALAPIQLARGIIAMMENANRGYIINIASRAGLVGFSDKGIYGASKAAAIRFFDAVYAKYLDSGVRVTSICPGWINTPMATAGGCEKKPEDLLQPQDISSLIAWLVSSNPRVRIRELTVEAGGSTTFQ